MKFARIKSGIIDTIASERTADCPVLVPDSAECGDAFDGVTLTPDDSRRIASIKAEANRRILARYPAWKQSNLTAAALEAIGAGQQPPQEALDAWAWVKEVRAHSDALESGAGMTANWPA